VQVEGTEGEHEPLSGKGVSGRDGGWKGKKRRGEGDEHVWAWKVIHGFEAETCVFY
jgi:hypothetical protein